VEVTDLLDADVVVRAEKIRNTSLVLTDDGILILAEESFIEIVDQELHHPRLQPEEYGVVDIGDPRPSGRQVADNVLSTFWVLLGVPDLVCIGAQNGIEISAHVRVTSFLFVDSPATIAAGFEKRSL
jgi:hypothetical protein